MAERVDTMPGNGRGAPVYPWGEWLDGTVWELTAGKDFECSASSMVNNAYRAAQSRLIKIRTARRGDRVYIQALLPGQDGGAR